jgi:hypothetical protein
MGLLNIGFGFKLLIILFMLNTIIINVNHSIKSAHLTEMLNKRILYNYPNPISKKKTNTITRNNNSDACIITFIEDIQKVNDWLATMAELELNFNQKFKHPYLIYSTFNFTLEMKATIAIQTLANVEFAVIDAEHWELPSYVDSKFLRTKGRNLKKFLAKQNLQKIYKARYFSGSFFRHPLSLKYK